MRNNAGGGEVYYSQYMNGAEGPSSSSGQKDIPTAENGCGFSGSKEGSYLSESGDSLRAILLDPLTYVFLLPVYFDMQVLCICGRFVYLLIPMLGF